MMVRVEEEEAYCLMMVRVAVRWRLTTEKT